ncbi:MAG: AMP-binding protein [Vibrio sp.]
MTSSHPSSHDFVPISLRMTQPMPTESLVAMGFCDPQLSKNWLQFESDVTTLTRLLSRHSEQSWALCFNNSYWFSVAFMATCHSQKHIVLPSNLQAAALAELADSFDAILHDDVLEDAVFEQVQLTQHRHYSVSGAAYSEPLQELAYEASAVYFAPLENINVTLFTSGSSGQPKAIQKPLELLEREVAQLHATWGSSLQNANFASTVSHQHIYGLLFRVLWPLSAGKPFWANNWQYPEQVEEHASENTVLISSPALLKRLSNGKSNSSYKLIFSSGGPLSNEAANLCHRQFKLYPHEVLGSTETGGIAHRQQLTAQTEWQTFVGTKADVNAEQCLKILSPLIELFDWYQTSDQCDLIDHNHFILKGRMDRVVKIEEKRISLTEVERRLNQLEQVEDAAVISLQDPKRIIIAAAIQLSATGQSQLELLGKGKFGLMLRKELHQWIEPVGIPRRFRFIDEIPLNTQGKRLVSEIERLFED